MCFAHRCALLAFGGLVALLGAAPTVEATDLAAYALYLQARQLGRQGTAEGLERSMALYQQALEIDPDYAAAWAGLARDYYTRAGTELHPIDEGYQLARDAANRALAIDPEYAPAYAQLGYIAVYHGDLATATRHLERALALDPTDSDIITNAAILARSLGRLDEAIALQEYAVARDPVNPIGHARLGLERGGKLVEAHRGADDGHDAEHRHAKDSEAGGAHFHARAHDRGADVHPDQAEDHHSRRRL